MDKSKNEESMITSFKGRTKEKCMKTITFGKKEEVNQKYKGPNTSYNALTSSLGLKPLYPFLSLPRTKAPLQPQSRPFDLCVVCAMKQWRSDKQASLW